MGVEFKTNFDIGKWKSDLRARAARAVETQMELIAGEIVARTQGGTDAEGRAFKPYSRGYAAMRRASGRSADPVDLTFTGQMLKAVHSKITQAMNYVDGVIYITAGQAEKARKHMQGIGVPKRDFFKLSKAQIRSLVEALRKVKLIG